MRLILASNSPRRRELLALTGLPFVVMATEIDERTLPGEHPLDYVRRIADQKANVTLLRLGIHLEDDVILIACDTAVVVGDDILGKPKDANQAAEMLRKLRGDVHQVYSGLIVMTGRKKRLRDVFITNVPMRDYHEAEILAYIESGDPLDKAGAYAIQHPEFQPVVGLSGCYANVMGLPLCHLTRTLREMGVVPKRDVPAACQAALDYDCPVYRDILDVRV